MLDDDVHRGLCWIVPFLHDYVVLWLLSLIFLVALRDSSNLISKVFFFKFIIPMRFMSGMFV